jgi:hypothetical protein
MLINFGKKKHLEIDHWEDLKTNRKIEVDLRNMAFDVDKSTAAALKFYHFPQNL